MLEKPDLQDEKIITCLQAEYGLKLIQVTFLPLGADVNTAVYRVVAEDETPYFLKLRSGVFDETSVALPKFLSDQGVGEIIAPLPSQSGQLWASLDAFKVILYPFIAGHNGYEAALSDQQWIDFGRALKRIHTAAVPPALTRRIQQERYSPQGRERVRMFLERAGQDPFAEPVAAQTAALLRAKREQILDLIGHAEQCVQALQAQSTELVVCHSDLHAGNILLAAGDTFYIVDWDNPILAPKERDLMYAGGGQFGSRRTPQEEEALFYQGYGQTEVNHTALAYYRYERIVQDISEFCQQLLLSDEGGADRENSLGFLASNFRPGGAIEIAYQADSRG